MLLVEESSMRLLSMTQSLKVALQVQVLMFMSLNLAQIHLYSSLIKLLQPHTWAHQLMKRKSVQELQLQSLFVKHLLGNLFLMQLTSRVEQSTTRSVHLFHWLRRWHSLQLQLQERHQSQLRFQSRAISPATILQSLQSAHLRELLSHQVVKM